ncbi:MAG TPA: prolipoprotein diacylglyceryl transferase family protein [Polyangiaceae bacterium]|nr:prolipoprotein diacylglyceryl transferase family protein [Polyangiaceae bacterium]
MLTRNAAAGALRRSLAFAMHPVLVVVPSPELGILLWPALVVLALVGAGIGAVAFRRNNAFVAVLGAMLAAAALALAFSTRTSRLSVGSFEVRAWGACFAAALVIGSVVALRRATRLGFDRELVARVCVLASVGGVIGARIAWVLLHPTATESVEGAAAFYRGGLSVWGGLIGALVVVKLSSRASGTSLRRLADLAAPSFAIGVALTRLGCFLEGCDFGVPLSNGAPRFIAALGTFPKESPAWIEHVLSRGLSPSANASLAVHPIALYEAVGGAALVLFAFLLRRRPFRPGVVFVTVTFAYLVLRVALDSLRADPMEMWVSGTLLLSGVLIGSVALGIRFLRAPMPKVTQVKK